MKTNAQFDEAWRDLINARRAEDINAVHRAAERLAHASRMLQLDASDVKENPPTPPTNIAEQIRDACKPKPKQWHENI